ncbi:hypothetical protein EV363DRAFT_1397940 [Boletus edulis]|nr:hypothetical protein EV363DRAFT_1397940 [Boletus edulis]
MELPLSRGGEASVGALGHELSGTNGFMGWVAVRGDDRGTCWRTALTKEQIVAAGLSRQLSIVVDVSCDTTHPFNPIPIYDINTTFSNPTVPVELGNVVPSLSFSADLFPSLLELPRRQSARVWTDAEKIFKEKVSEAMGVQHA